MFFYHFTEWKQTKKLKLLIIGTLTKAAINDYFIIDYSADYYLDLL